jgi:hypothetical protein
VKRILALLMVSLFLVAALAVTASMAFADPDCAPPTKPPCHDPGGPPGPGNFVGPGGGAKQANHHHR